MEVIIIFVARVSCVHARAVFARGDDVHHPVIFAHGTFKRFNSLVLMNSE